METDKRTVVVKGINYAWTKADFENAFSDVGPIRKCFLVEEKGSKRHKGTGFVQYALPEDAERAIAELNGMLLGGRKLQVAPAHRRLPLEERKKRKHADSDAGPDAAPAPSEVPPAGDQPRPSASQAPLATKYAQAHAAKGARYPPRDSSRGSEGGPARRDMTAGGGSKPVKDSNRHKHVRTVALGGVPDQAMAAALKLARSLGKVEEVVQEVGEDLDKRFNLTKDGCSGSVALLVYDSVKSALQAVSQLHGRELAAERSEGRPKKKAKRPPDGSGGDRAHDAAVLWARQLGGEGAHIKRWRVIVRNLPFSAKAEDLKKMFQAAGFVWEITLPRKSDGRLQGFGFVGFTCRAHAEAAIRLLNQKELKGRTLIVDWAVAKAQYMAATDGVGLGQEAERAEEEGQEGSTPHTTSSMDASLASDSDQEEPLDLQKEKGIMQSVLRQLEGHELSVKGRAEGHQKEKNRVAARAGGGEGKDEEHGPVEGSGDESDRNVTDGDMSEEEGSDDGEASQEEDEEEEEEDEMETGGAGEDSEEEEDVPQGRDAPSSIAGDKGTAAGRGSGRAGGRGAGEVLPGTVFVRGLPLDVSSPEVQSRFESFGRVRSCRLVMDKSTGKQKGTAFIDYWSAADAQKAAAASARGRTGEGPGIHIGGRAVQVDMALSQEGAVRLATNRSENGSRDNRNLYLTKEGRIEEGSPAWQAMSAEDRKRRQRAAQEMASKLRSPNFFVSRTRLCIRNIPYALDEKALKQLVLDAVKQHASKAHPKVKQVKILRDQDKTAADGKPASRGMAFVELEEHEHAICALRSLNNNPAPFGRDRRPLVEFAVESIRAVKTRELKQARARQTGKSGPLPAQAEHLEPDQAPPRLPANPAGKKRPRPPGGNRDADLRDQAVDGSSFSKRQKTQVAPVEEQQGQGSHGLPVGDPSQRLSKAALKRMRKKRARAKTGGVKDSTASPAAAQRAKFGNGVPSTSAPKAKDVAQSGKRSKLESKGLESRSKSGAPGGPAGVGTRDAGKPPQQQKRSRKVAGAAGGQQKEVVGNGKKKSGEITDKLDDLVARYQAKLFGGGGAKSAPGIKTGALFSKQMAELRWFE
eukprot:jgi/Botrbrau1/5833/Bobra.0366s0015.1